MLSGRDVYETAYRDGWRPEPHLSVSAWADTHRVLGNRAGHAAIHWRTAVTPCLRDIMDALWKHRQGSETPRRQSDTR